MSQIHYYSPLAIYIFFLGMYIYQYIYPGKYIKLSFKYAIYYLTLIFIFGLIYFDFTPDLFFNSNEKKYIELYYDLKMISKDLKILLISMYYSVVTITTLGFGDISPNSLPSIIITLIESILGIIFIGFFLNSLSHERSQKEEEKYKIKLLEEEKRNEREKILKFYLRFMMCYTHFYNLLSDIYFGATSGSNLKSFKNKEEFGELFKKEFEYKCFLNLEEESKLYSFAGSKGKDCIRTNISSLKLIINDIVFSYHFKHYKEFQIFFENWLKTLDVDVSLKSLDKPLSIDQKNKLINLTLNSEISNSSILFPYKILQLILFFNIEQYDELIKKMEKLKTES